MLEIRLLGQYEVRCDGELIEIASRPARLLLAYLALTAPKRHLREKVAGLLWPDSDEANARSNLRQALWRLRKSVGEQVVLVDNETVGFNTGIDHWLDTAFLVDGPDGELAAAVAAYGGELLPGFYEDWVLLERERLRAAYERQMQRLLDTLIQKGEWAEVIRWAEQWIATGQVPEPAYRAIMIAHAAQGDRAAVAATYERCLAALQAEVGVEPSTETRDLVNQLLREGPPAEQPPRTADETGQSTRPAHNLPLPSTAIIGREPELAQIRELLVGARLLTILGPGGMGKTRLALQAAAEQLETIEDGVFFVSLAPVESPDDVVKAIAESIGFPLSSHEDPRRQLLRHLRYRRYLLLLDNFEHLLPAAALVGDILRQAAGITLLVTSREGLNLQEETHYRIQGLGLPRTPMDPALLDFGAIRLFVEAARRLRPGFVLTSENAADIARIGQLLDGMPLGILLAAAWVDQLTPKEIADEIAVSLDFLQAQWRDMPSRHRSMRAVFESAWRRLSAEQQELFAALAVFRGGFTREAAEHVAGASLQGLAGLVNQSLLWRDLETGRYAIHELLRQYAQERLEAMPQQGQAVTRAHAEYYAQEMQQQWLQLTGPNQQQALATIDADLANLRRAWRYWLRRKESLHLEMFIDGFWRAFDVRGWFNTGAELFAEAVQLLAPPADAPADEATSVVYARLLSHHAYFLTEMGYADQGQPQAEASVAILRRLGLRRELAIPLTTLQWTVYYLRDPLQRTRTDLDSIEFGGGHDGRWKKAYVRCWNGRTFAWHGDAEFARSQLEESLALFEELQDRLATIWPRLELGHLAAKRGELDEANSQFSRVLREARATGFDWAMAKAARYLGNVAAVRGEFLEARRQLLTSLRLAERLGMIRDLVSALYDIAAVEAASGDKERAIRWLTLVRHHPLSDQTRTFSVWLGEPHVHFNDLAQALLDQLRTQVTAESFAAAAAAGRALELESVVLELLSL